MAPDPAKPTRTTDQANTIPRQTTLRLAGYGDAL